MRYICFIKSPQSPAMKTITVTTTKMEFVKDANGNYVLDAAKVARFRKRCIRDMEKQNAQVRANPALARSFDICDPEAFADFQIRVYASQLRLMVPAK